MASILESDRYNDTGDCMKRCSYCDAPVASSTGSITVGLCSRHEAVWKEDLDAGLHKQNRLKDIILKTKDSKSKEQ